MCSKQYLDADTAYRAVTTKTNCRQTEAVTNASAATRRLYIAVDEDEIVRACRISMASRFRRIPNMYLFTRALSSSAVFQKSTGKDISSKLSAGQSRPKPKRKMNRA